MATIKEAMDQCREIRLGRERIRVRSVKRPTGVSLDAIADIVRAARAMLKR